MPDTVDETLQEIENGAWLTATLEPNRQQGMARRQYMGNLIRQKLNGIDRAALNDALYLEISLDNVLPSVRRLRRGVRAIMLAQFALKGYPLNQAGVLKERWLNQSEDVIRRGFLNCFPAVNDPNDPARLAWAPAQFTDPRTFPDWVRGPINFNYRFIVTCLPTDSRADAILAAPNVVIASWAAISTSVIDETNSILYGYYGFILRVPAENVLIANGQDQNLLNHLGTGMTRTPNQEAGMSPEIKAGLLSQHLADLFAAQRRLKPPLECIQQNRNGRWNEVVVAGRSPTTGRATEVIGLFFRVGTNHRYYNAQNTRKSPITEEIENKVTAAARVFGLPLIYIPDASGKWG